MTWQLAEAQWRIYSTLLWAKSHLCFSNTLKIHFKQDGESAKGSNRHNWCTSWYCGVYLGFLRHSNWRSSTQVKGLAGLLVTKMSNRKEEESRIWLLLFEVLLDITAFWKQLLTYFTALCNEWVRGANEKYIEGSYFPLKLSTQAVNIHCKMSKHISALENSYPKYTFLCEWAALWLNRDSISSNNSMTCYIFSYI